MDPSFPRHRIFLLSPANAGGDRAKLVLSGRAQFELADRLRRDGAPIGEVFAFISGLYFRGKLAYANAFGAAPPGLPCALVITPSRGLVPAEMPITLDELRDMAAVPIDETESRYRMPMERDAHILDGLAGSNCDYVLLGSIATSKYVDPLLKVFGERLLFPAEFVGRGDMSRGGLLLRCARLGVELSYVPISGAVRHGPRPPKLPKWKRTS